MKIIMFGASGFLGTHLYNYLKKKNNVLRCGRSKNNDIILKKIVQKKLTKILQKNITDVIINLISLTDVDLCERKPKKADEVNHKIVKNIVNSIIKSKLSNKVFFLHISTDQVYSGKGPHKEKFTNPINVYAKTKLRGEKYVKKINGCVLRTNFVGKSFDYKKKNLADWIFNSLNGRKNIQVFKNVKFSPLSIKTLCKYINLVINKKISGTYNIGSKNGLSKAQFAVKFAKKLKLNTNFLEVVNYKKKILIAKRPLDMRMDSNYFKKKFNILLGNSNYEINLVSKQYK
jgi:dTDP-4-dehydrorhamnose reductase